MGGHFNFKMAALRPQNRSGSQFFFHLQVIMSISANFHASITNLNDSTPYPLKRSKNEIFNILAAILKTRWLTSK